MEKKINFIASFAAFIASIIALFTLFEIQKQRETSYLPDIAIHQSDLYIRDSILNPKCFYNGDLMFANDSISRKKELNLKVENIGFGTAKSVNLQFRYDEKKISRLLNRVDRDSEVLFQKNEDNGFVEIVSYDNLECRRRYYNNTLNNYSFDFILPTQSYKADYFIEFPPEYITTSLRYVLKRKENKEIFPSLFLDIEFYDVGDKKITKTIEFYILYSTYEIKNGLISANGIIKTGKRREKKFTTFGLPDSQGRRIAFKASGDDARLIIYEKY